MKDAEELLAIAEEGVRICKRVGGSAAEVYVRTSETTAINAVGRYAIPTEAFDEGVAVRIADGGRMGQSGSTGIDARTIERVARHALDAARRVPDSTKFPGFAPPAAKQHEPTRIHPALATPDAGRVSAEVELASDRIASSPGVTYSGASILSWRSRWAVANTAGAAVWDQNAGERIQLEARVTRGTTERSAQGLRAHPGPLTEAWDLAAFADEVVGRAASALDAKPLPGPIDDVILTPGPLLQVLGLFTPAFSARRVRAGQSPLAGKLGAAIASPLLTMRDAPLGPGGVHHQRADAEGTPTGTLTLVEDGHAVGWMYDHESAVGEGRASTGHGLRAGVTGGIAIRPVNLDVAPGAEKLDAIIQGAERAVLVNESMMGGFVANDTTGDFSMVAPFAFLVERGRIAHALPPTTVAGNAHAAMRAVKAVSRDRLATIVGTYPAMRVGGVTCAT